MWNTIQKTADISVDRASIGPSSAIVYRISDVRASVSHLQRPHRVDYVRAKQRQIPDARCHCFALWYIDLHINV